MAFAEALVIWLAGAGFANTSMPQKVSLGDFSISANGEWGVSRISYQSKAQRRIVHDVVLHNLRGQNAVRLHIGHYRPQSVAVSTTGDIVAIACEDGSIRVGSASPGREPRLSADHARLRPLDRTPENPVCLAFSPDGRLLAATGTRLTCVWQWPDGKLLQEWPHSGVDAKFLSFTDDSRRVLLPGPEGEVLLCDAYTGQPVKIIRAISPEDGYAVFRAAVSHDARLAAVAVSCRELRVYSLVNNEELWRRSTSGISITFSPDGRFLATDRFALGSSGSWRITVYDAFSGQHLCDLTGHSVPIARVAFASDGLLYSWDPGGLIRAWNVESQCEQWSFSTLSWASNHPSFL
jgi:WD40 repeat protein